MSETDTGVVLPSSPGAVFLIGIGGIGMSGLAQLLRHQGHVVAGSDRDLTGAGRRELFDRLGQLGIGVCAQDGSGVRRLRPELVIHSSAVEPDNPDRVAAAELALPSAGRAVALAAALDRCQALQIAVAGSCGKTTVTGWISSALRALGRPVLTVCGGVIRELESEQQVGNFGSDPSPAYQVYEVDESDGSLVAFRPDYGVLLNVGTDHHDRDKLIRMFRTFVGRCRRGVVLPAGLRAELAVPGSLAVQTFAPLDTDRADALCPSAYSAAPEGIRFSLPGCGPVRARQFGRHSADNAAAAAALLRLLPDSPRASALPAALAAFRGVRQRFDLIGCTPNGAAIYNDYAHNVEKIQAALLTAQELCAGRVVAAFQPHGYGPLGFMREPFRDMLARTLREDDALVLLPVYYAGGTTSFKPTSEEVAAEYAMAGLPVAAAADRCEARRLIRERTEASDCVLVMGARDPSIPAWAERLTE